MNGGTLLVETKLLAPRRRVVVARPRLLSRLGGADLPAVTLVSAPAGFGKTTLLTEWFATANDAGFLTAWVSLDRSESDPLLFWSYVITAIRRAVPALDACQHALPAAPAPVEDVVTSLVNDLASLRDELVLVLDDYHVVESMEVHESIRFLIEHLPSRMHLVLATRADPPLPLAALRARGELLEVRAAELRFTAAEANKYLNDTSGLSLTFTDVESLLERTEGWIAALQLASISLQGRADPSEFIASFAGDDRFVVDYLVDDVLNRLSDHMRSFLAQTSILNRFTAPLCDAVTMTKDSKLMLEELERSNLFVVALDDRRQWYRYHHLFRDVLRARLLEERSEQVAELHRRACGWFQTSGDRAEAVRHAMAAGDFTVVAELVELEIPALRRVRQDATQREWLDAIPEQLFTNRPVLNMARVGARMVTSDVTGVDALLDDIERCLAPGRSTADFVVYDEEEFRRLPTQVAMYRAGLALLRGDRRIRVRRVLRRHPRLLARPGGHAGRSGPAPRSAAHPGVRARAGGGAQPSTRLRRHAPGVGRDPLRTQRTRRCCRATRRKPERR